MSFFKFCPGCGSQHIEFVNHRRLECFDCGMIYYHNVAAAVAVIIEQDERILFTVRNNEPGIGMLDLPGGFVDPDETAADTCSRELKEELNLKISPDDFYFFKSNPNDYTYREIPYKTEDMIFIAKLPNQANIELEASEIQAVRWIEKSKINLNEIAFKSIKETIKQYLYQPDLPISQTK